MTQTISSLFWRGPLPIPLLFGTQFATAKSMVPSLKVPCQCQLPPPLAINKFEAFTRSKSHKYMVVSAFFN